MPHATRLQFQTSSVSKLNSIHSATNVPASEAVQVSNFDCHPMRSARLAARECPFHPCARYARGFRARATRPRRDLHTCAAHTRAPVIYERPARNRHSCPVARVRVAGEGEREWDRAQKGDDEGMNRERRFANEMEERRRKETGMGVRSIVKAARLPPPRVPSRPSRPFIKLHPLILSIPRSTFPRHRANVA